MKKLLTIMGIPLGPGVQYANFGNDNIHKDTDKERCARTTYFIGGNKICKNSFLFLMGNCVMRYRWPWMNPFEGPFSSGKEKMPCKNKQMSVAKEEVSAFNENEMCHHEVHCAVISSLDSCVNCSGPVSSRKWLGLTCKLCSRTWHKTCLMKNEKLVHHSQSLSETQLQQWVSLKKDGTVLCGHCTCKAALGEVCSHVTALLYAIDSAVKHLEDKSCTDGPRQWGLPPLKAGKALYEEGSGIDFSNPAKKRCGVNHQSQVIHL
nr:uncharacterized protein LOC129435407 [Misgurnus anguillicaudatus]XP_055049693.1 uncharacterized protein LOC129435407 [Misgurnus anguillicaudatus]